MLKIFGKFYVVSKITVQQRNLKQQKKIKKLWKISTFKWKQKCFGYFNKKNWMKISKLLGGFGSYCLKNQTAIKVWSLRQFESQQQQQQQHFIKKTVTK